MRRKIIAGNWKMNKTVTEAVNLVQEITASVGTDANLDVVICPPYTALCSVRQSLVDTSIALGAQDVFWKSSGAYTSQISAPMLVDLGVTYVIIGHSETRGRFGVPEVDLSENHMKHFGESDETVNLKLKCALAAGLTPIVCVGETLSERTDNNTDSVVTRQVKGALSGVTAEAGNGTVVFAYEPVWAIGTGEVCATDEANRVCGVVRSAVADVWGAAAGEAVRIQYGGSMKPDNAAELLSQPNIDGGLIGGASLKATDFAAIVFAAGA